MTTRPFARTLLSALAALAVAAVLAPRADAVSAALSKDGTLYEVFVTNYGSVVSGAREADASLPVVALRTTAPGRESSVEVVGGSVSPYLKFGESLAYDDSTRTVFVVYTNLQVQGFFADVRAAMRRDGGWSDGGFLPNGGLYASVNPKLVVTRQTYTTFDAGGRIVTKKRSILSVVWWEESVRSQARYAPLFIEDGAMKFEDLTAYNLNDLTGTAGPTSTAGLPTSSYMFPAVERDPASNGGVLVSFANLATRTQQVLRLGFQDDDTKPAGGGSASPGRTSNSRSTPIGRGTSEFPLPSGIDLPFTLSLGTVIPSSGAPTYWWSHDGVLTYQSGDAASLARGPLEIPLRPDFQLDSALAAVRTMVEKQ